MRYVLYFALLAVLTLWSFKQPTPVLYIIGDSTVKTGQGNGENEMWGWGSIIPEYFDTTKIKIENHAIGGRSSRTFITEGRWDVLLPKFKKGDFLLVQFGHNDESAINDSLRARGTLKGTGSESQTIFNLLTKRQETVYTFGQYMKRYANEAKSKGVIVILCSPVPRNNFEESGKIKRSVPFYPDWTKEIASKTGAGFINLHELTASVYENLGTKSVKENYFTHVDNTHTNKEGARLNAEKVVAGIKELKKIKLKKYLI